MEALRSSEKSFSTTSIAPICAKDVMTAPVIAVDRSEPLKQVANLLASNAISGVPVLDEFGHLQGIITEADLLAKEEGTDTRARAKPFVTISKRTQKFFRSYEGRTAGDAMTTPVITADPSTPLGQIAGLMRESGIKAVPILEKDLVVGIVARRDVLKVFQRTDADLAKAVTAKLIGGIAIDPQDCKVVVEEGIVKVSGTVSTRSQFEHVEGYIRALDSVVDVDLSSLSYEVDDISMRDQQFPVF